MDFIHRIILNPLLNISWSFFQAHMATQELRWQMLSSLQLPTQKRMPCMWILKGEPKLDAKQSVRLAWHAMTGRSSGHFQRSVEEHKVILSVILLCIRKKFSLIAIQNHKHFKYDVYYVFIVNNFFFFLTQVGNSRHNKCLNTRVLQLFGEKKLFKT